MAYGVVPTGFAVKRLPEILASLEAQMIAAFGPAVIQSAQSPLGQLNGLFADAARELWETALDTYQSFDVDQAEGPRLDILSKLRRLSRPDDELDLAYRGRITNQGEADISTTETINRIKDIAGVTWAAVRINSTGATDSLGLPGHSVAYAVTGGDDEEVALEVYQATVGGIGLHGNTQIAVVADGFCQQVKFIRPVSVPVMIEIDVRRLADPCNCAPPAVGTITANVVSALNSVCGYRNGDVVTKARIQAEAAQHDGIEVAAVRIARRSNLIVADTLAMTLFERPLFDVAYTQTQYIE